MRYTDLLQEIRELNDKSDRLEAAIDTVATTCQRLGDRAAPASIAQLRHELDGAVGTLGKLAGTVEHLAAQLYSVTDRLTLLERVIAHDLPPEVGEL